MSDDHAPANAAQHHAWDGPTGEYWAAHADRYDRGTAGYREPFLDAADVRAADRVLDVGCGNGLLARELARRARSVVGVDLSGPMLAVARARAAGEGLSGVEFVRADAQTHPFGPGAFDLVVSQHGAMFFDDPAAAFANLSRALCPGGRLVLLVWRPLAEQEWLSAFLGALRLPPPPPGGPCPTALGDPDRVRCLLAGAGFSGVELSGLDRPMWFGDSAGDATGFIAGQFSGAVDPLEPDVRRRRLDALHAVMSAHETPDGVLFRSACWLVTARLG